MSDHYVIIADLANTQNDNAFIDIASEEAGRVSYILQDGRTFDIPFGFPNGFASSPDFFALDPPLPLPSLVIARTDANVPARATLRQKKSQLAILSSDRALGIGFLMAFADSGQGAQLFIANPGLQGTTATVNVFALPAADISLGIRIAVGQVVQVNLPASLERTCVVARSINGVQVIAQLGTLGRGQEFTLLYLQPTL